MHGRPRKPLKPEDEATSIAKASKLGDLQNLLLHNHHNHIYTKDALEASSKLLEMNPEVYTAWNYRKLAVQHNLCETTDSEIVKSIVDEELRVVAMALRRNYKAYGAWHHRKWILSRNGSSVDLDHEFRLLDQLLKADSRNFHAWNYRRFVAGMKNVTEVEELKFTTDKIKANFSNYSAWHNRSVLLSNLLKQKVQGFVSRDKILTEEYEFVHQALFTDPDDQSGWFYHLWLLDQTVTPDDPLLISTWPVHGSDWILSTNKNMDGWKLFPSTSSSLHYSLRSGTLPIILYFNQVVTGVSSSSVTVKSILVKNENLIWRPLSTTSSGQSQCWATYLKIPDAKYDDLKACTIEVSLGHSQDIIASNGSHYSNPLQFQFTVNIRSAYSEQNEEESVQELVAWNGDDMFINGGLSQDSAVVISFDQLRITKDHVPEASKWQTKTLSNEITLFKELLSEMNCKIAKLTLARLLVAHDAIMSNGTFLMQKRIHSGEVLGLYDDLIKLDPSHAKYYKDERSLVLMDQDCVDTVVLDTLGTDAVSKKYHSLMVTSDKETLMKHCWHYKLTSSSPHHNVCLQLSKLSLSRVGFVNHLLWVEVLDLSHNELRSIEGLEALQLLSCLNLSNNRFSSFSALEPLKLLNSLRVLDISFNEIGDHSIDTTRYLCLSPLSHTIRIDWQNEAYMKDNIKAVDHWEAILFLKDLHLTQLDIKGNAVANEDFRKLLTKVLPSLNWLDGSHVQ